MKRLKIIVNNKKQTNIRFVFCCVAVWPTGFESGLKIPKKKTGYPSLSGAEGGGRTLMKLPSRDFESRASAIPPLRQIFVERNHFNTKNICLQAFFIQFSKKVDFLKKRKKQAFKKTQKRLLNNLFEMRFCYAIRTTVSDALGSSFAVKVVALVTVGTSVTASPAVRFKT